MPFLRDVLSPAASVVGDVVMGYDQDRKQRVLEAVQAQARQRQAQNDAIENALKARTLRTPVLGDPAYTQAQGAIAGAQANARIPAAIDEARRLLPVKVQQARDTAAATAPIDVKKAVDIATGEAPIKTQQAIATEHGVAPIRAAFEKPTVLATPTGVVRVGATGPATPITDAQGHPVIKQGAASLAAPMAAKVGQFGEMLKKASDLLPAMDALDVSLGQGTAQDMAAHGVKVPLLGVHIPGTQALGAEMVNRSPSFATYQASLTPFVLAAAHALSGARINQDQVSQIRQSIEIQPGESAASRAQKKKNLVDLINSIGGSLPKDAIGAQEGQMGDEPLTRLTGYGYKRVGVDALHAGSGDPEFDALLAKYKRP